VAKKICLDQFLSLSTLRAPFISGSVKERMCC